MTEQEKKIAIASMADELETTAMKSADEEIAKIESETGESVDRDMVENKINAWATNYAATLIANLDDTTQGSIDELEREFQEKQITDAEYVDALERIFGTARAESVAVTETTTAISKGALLAWESSGAVDEAFWLTEQDDLVDIDCEENEAIGPLPIGATYPSGHSEPPAHPNCRCTLVPLYR